MTPKQLVRRGSPILALIVLAACADSTVPTGPNTVGPFGQSAVATLPSQSQRAAWFAQASPEVMALNQTVFADDDEATGQLVFGVEHAGVANGVRAVMSRFGIPASAYRIVVTEPIMPMGLRDNFASKVGGIQIHFGNYLCTLGFNVRTATNERSFITNSHCTKRQGAIDGIDYYQPLKSVDNTVIAKEVDDPAYTSLPGCSGGKACRYSDAARAAYMDGVPSTGGEIAKPSGMNGVLATNGTFSITSESNAVNFSGVVNKVGRTTGWTSGTVSQSCTTVNVLGSKVQLLCQTLVSNPNAVIVGSGDSGSPVFIGTSNVTLAGILWGGSSDGHTLVFSPLASIKAELGGFTAGSGAGGTDGITGGSGDGGGDPSPCVPRGNGNNCK